MKYIIIISLLACCNNCVIAQEKADQAAIEKEVNEQVWKPFSESYKNGNAELFNSLHTDDVLRVTPSGMKIGKEYKDSISKKYGNPNREPREIHFWFEHRIYSGDTGYEVGYYRVTQLTGSQEKYYGRFHVVLKKINGVWKIARDWDTDIINGRKITEEDFRIDRMLRFE